MEDIAQKTVEFGDNIIKGPRFSIDVDRQFSEIGLRYGFIMDTKLLLSTYTKEYKECWLKLFNHIASEPDIAFVDSIEDCLIELIQIRITDEAAFFINALDTGSLTQDWIDKALLLLNTPANPATDTPVKEMEETNETKDTAISHANTEKNTIHKQPSRRLSTTRRKKHIITGTKKIFSKTHRHH